MDMYGSVVSNIFHVSDEAAFRCWFEQYKFGDEIQVERMEKNVREDRKGIPLQFHGSEHYPSAYPKVPGDRDTETDDTDADIEEWAGELRQHLLPDEILYVVACGSEGGRYAAAEELAVSHHKHRFRAMCSDDNADAQRLLTEQA